MLFSSDAPAKVFPLLARAVMLASLWVPFTYASTGTTVNSTSPSAFTIEQTSQTEQLGTWTFIDPFDKKWESREAAATIDNLLPGRYTFIAASPAGMVVALELLNGTTLLEMNNHGQIFFDLPGGSHYKVRLTYKLAFYGKIGVTSIPAGIPFELRGPDDLRKTGKTPETFILMPVGDYSVEYQPEGCPHPFPKAATLDKGKQVYFTTTIACTTLKVSASSAKRGGNETQTLQGDSVAFTDVPSSAWFAPYVHKAARFGILSGYRDNRGNPTGLFAPSNLVNVAEVAKIVHEVLGVDESYYNVRPQNPQAGDSWFSRYFASAEKRDWRIFQDPSLDPARPATRGEVVVTLLQALDIPLEWPTGEVFRDVKRRTLYANAIETAAKHGLIQGKTKPDGRDTGFFEPEKTLNRAEMAKIIATVIDKRQELKQKAREAYRESASSSESSERKS